MHKRPPITIGSFHAPNLADFGKALGQINQYVKQVQNAGSEGIAEILRVIILEVITDPRLEGKARWKAIKNLRTLAREASLHPAKRHLKTVRGALATIPRSLITSLDIFSYFQVHLADLRKFFNISG